MQLIYLDKNKASWIKIIKLYPPDGLTFDEFEQLWKHKPAEKHKIILRGNLQECPRYTKVYLKPYYFSRMNHEIDTNMPDRILCLLENYAKKLNPDLNQSLVNWYESDGCIGKHSDDEGQLKKNSEIFSFSFGPATRTFVLEPKIKNENIRYKIRLEHNTLVIMGGKCQENYLHSVPRSRSIKSTLDERRLNITFRCFN
jgi:alkylated DNA repair dioxygenase AlkB